MDCDCHLPSTYTGAFLIGAASIVMVLTGIGHIVLFLRWRQYFINRLEGTTGRTRCDFNPDATLPTDSNKSEEVGNPNYKDIEMLEEPVNTSISGPYDDIIYIS